MNKLTRGFAWLITSSQDPNKVGLTVKAALVAIAPLAIMFLKIDQMQFNEIVDAIVQLVYVGTALISAIGVIWGLFRKVSAGRWTASNDGV